MEPPLTSVPPVPRPARARASALLGLGFALVLASTLEIEPFRANVIVRMLALLAGLVPVVAGLMILFPEGRVDESNRRRFVLAVLGIHALATLYVLPPGALLNRRPLITADHAVHYAQCVRAKRVFWRSLRTDSYNPYFMAGYPAGTIFDVDMKGAEFFCTVLPLPSAVTLKAFVLAAYLSLVITLFAGARMLGFRTGESACGLLAFLAYWHWGRPYAGDFRFVGMFSFVLASHLCLLLAGVLRRVLAGAQRRTFFILAPLTFVVHISASVMALAPLATVLVADRVRLRRRNLELLFMSALVVLLVNVLWLKPVIEFLPEKLPTQVYYQLHGVGDLWRLLAKPSASIAWALLGLALLGVVRLAREGRARIGAPCLVTAVFLLCAASYGVRVPGLNQMEPGRFLFSVFVFAAPLAGVGLAWLFDHAPALSLRIAHVPVRALALAAAIVAGLPLALLEAKAYYRHTVSADFTPEVKALCAAIDAHVRPRARLMIEDASAAAYGGTHLPALIPMWTGVEQIGGPYPHTPLRHYRTSFTTASILGTPLSQWKSGRLRERLAFLRVGWIVTATPATTAFVDSLGYPTRVWAEPPYTLWELPDARSWEPQVVSSFDRLEVKFTAPVTGAFIPYHWVRGLRTSAPAEIVPVLRYDDPVPYIYVRPRGLSRVVITY